MWDGAGNLADFDGSLAMALSSPWTRQVPRLTPMPADDAEMCVSGGWVAQTTQRPASAVATAERLAGQPATSRWDQDLAARMAQVGVPVMEERLVEVLLADIQK